MSTFAQVTGHIKLNESKLAELNIKQRTCLSKAADAALSEIKDSGVMPFDTGNLQNSSTFIRDNAVSSGRVSIVSSTPYARRLYYHPEYNFRRTHNGNAGGKWFEAFDVRNFVTEAYKKFFKGEL